jgi:hypothetical protein
MNGIFITLLLSPSLSSNCVGREGEGARTVALCQKAALRAALQDAVAITQPALL